MKKKSSSQSAFFNLRVLIGLFVFLTGVFIALGAAGLFLGPSKAQAQPGSGSAAPTANSPNGPDVVRLVGPVVVNTDLRDLPYIPPAPQILQRRLTRYPLPEMQEPVKSVTTSGFAQFQALIKEILRPVPEMPPPLLTFDGVDAANSQCGCLPPDTNGDVGPNHYVQSVNVVFQVFDKNGNTLSGPTTFDSFFLPLGNSTPCGNNQNQGDPFVFYDQIADRWVITDFAFPSFPGNSFWECIGVSQTGDPVAGGWFLYALQVDPANPTFLGDYPKLALWPDAYYLSMNLFSPAFSGVRVYALDRASMISGGPTNAVGFTIGLAGVADSYSLQPAGFRTGNPPPAGRQEFFLAVDAQFPGITQTQVHGWLFHVDFVNSANSTFGVGPDHTPNGEITVNPFVEAWTNTTYNLVPQLGTTQKLDTLGDKIMTPLLYQNRNGTESLWADQTVMLNYPNGPTVVRWYQFDVTGGIIPATPVQQQDWSNGNDGLWRWMPSIAVDQNGNTAISAIPHPARAYMPRSVMPDVSPAIH